MFAVIGLAVAAAGHPARAAGPVVAVLDPLRNDRVGLLDAAAAADMLAWENSGFSVWGELVQEHDDRAIVQASADELPAIDIHSL
jgi:hypothetical protein